MLVENSPDSHKPVETGDGSLSGTKARAIWIPLHPALHPATNSARVLRVCFSRVLVAPRVSAPTG